MTALLLGAIALPSVSDAQSRKPAPAAPAAPSLSAPRSLMAGAAITVFASRAPSGARLAIARPDDPPERAIAMVMAGPGALAMPAPGLPGTYELRLLAERDGKPEIVLRQPLATTEASATLAAPERVSPGASFPVRGIGPNGERDRVVIVSPDTPAEAEGPHFFPAENVEATLDAPPTPGPYELRYVMNAPLSGQKILARRPLRVE